MMQTAGVPEIDPKASMETKAEDSKFSMFEDVISKYFEIIKSIMPKLTSLSLENQEFQKTIFLLENKMAKIEKDQQNLHYEVRSNHITIDSKMNNILAEYSNITNENAKIRKQTEELTRQFKIHNSHQRTSAIYHHNPPPQPVIEVENKQETPVKESKVEEEEEEEEEGRKKEKRNFLKKKGKKITFNEEVTNRQMRLKKRNAKILTSRSKNSLSFDEEENTSEFPDQNDSVLSSKNDVFNSDKMLELTEQRIAKSIKSQKVILRKGTQKSLTKLSEAQKKTLHQSQSHKVILDNKRDDYLQNSRFDEILQQIESFHRNNQQIKNNYQQLMSEYCKTTQDQFNRIDGQIKDIRSKLAEIDYVNVHIQKIKLTLESKMSSFVRDLEYKIDGKVQKCQYREFLIEINKRIAAIHEERKRVANKDQTKKAIEFLENKLNIICETFQEIQRPPKLHLVDLEANTFRRGSGHSRSTQRPSTIQEGRPSKFCPVRPSPILASTHEQRPSGNGIDSVVTTKRQAESLHNRFKNEHRFNEDLSEFRMYSLEKREADQTKTLRKKSNTKQQINLTVLKEKSLEMLQKDKPKKRNKLKKEPLIFQYDN